MTKRYNQRHFRELVARGRAVDVTLADNADRDAIIAREGGLTRVGYSLGVNGVNGLLLRGDKSGTLYAVCSRSMATQIF